MKRWLVWLLIFVTFRYGITEEIEENSIKDNNAVEEEAKSEEEINRERLVEKEVNTTENEISSDTLSYNNKIRIGGGGYIMFGQIVSGHAYGRAGANPISNSWQNFYAGRIDIFSQPVSWGGTRISLEVMSSFPVIRESTIMKETFSLQYRPSLPEAVGFFNFTFDNNIFSSILIETGIIEYAFNPEVKNLGNYLHRSSAAPLNVFTKLDYIYSNLMAIKAELGSMRDQIKTGAIINSIINQSPFFDMNLSLYTSYLPSNKVFSGAFGICFERLIPIDDSLTKGIDVRHITLDTTLSFQATKLDAYVSFDIKKLLKENSLFGDNDLKLYGEAAIIGLRDPDYHLSDSIRPSLLNRIPFLVGFNIPTFKLLDFLTVEIEWCKYPYPFDWWGVSLDQPPTPKPFYPRDERWQRIYREEDNLKWSIYLKKSIRKFDIIGLIANDHIKYQTYSAESHQYTEQSLRKSKDWHWYIKLQYKL